MRKLALVSFLALACGAGAALAQTALATREIGFARPGGVYATLPGADPDACARACAADGLCMSWTAIADGSPRCELKAVIPHAVEDALAVSGLSARAPGFARLIAPREIGPPAAITGEQPQTASAPTPEPEAEAEEAIVEAVVAAPEDVEAVAVDPILLNAPPPTLPLRAREPLEQSTERQGAL